MTYAAEFLGKEPLIPLSDFPTIQGRAAGSFPPATAKHEDLLEPLPQETGGLRLIPRQDRTKPLVAVYAGRLWKLYENQWHPIQPSLAGESKG
uniref:Uncharacterized protein n=1 Tax=viral metagenome TaxID=1070528 RepID=A0A6H1ZJG6_9ZZZZ